MDIKELKNKLESNTVDDSLIIFKFEDNDFLPIQYTNYISKLKGIRIEYIDDLTAVVENNNDIFSSGIEEETLKVYRTEVMDDTINVRGIKNLIVICNKCASSYNDYVVEIPKLQEWQIKDYVYSQCEDIDKNKLDSLTNICKYDIFRLDSEINKLIIFPKSERKSIYDEFVEDDIFSDLSQYTIFSFTNAIVKKDISEVCRIYKEIDNIDIEPMGLLTTLLNNFRDIITVQLSNNPTPEGCNMPKGKFWAIRHSCGYYNKDQLIGIFGFLSEIDKKIKIGEMPMDKLIDYIVTKILII